MEQSKKIFLNVVGWEGLAGKDIFHQAQRS